ncbi:hypothetical protein ACVWW1_007853 [Bradyrhizobium sp. JR3.5]
MTELTGASASIARSSVLDATAVMVSSDCTGTAPICARAFIAGDAAACGSAAGFGLRLACFGRSVAGRAADASAVCAKPPAGSAAENENTDAPKIKARETLAPSAIPAPARSSLFWFGWRALH